MAGVAALFAADLRPMCEVQGGKHTVVISPFLSEGRSARGGGEGLAGFVPHWAVVLLISTAANAKTNKTQEDS